MPEQTIDIKRRFPEGAIFVPPAKLPKPSLPLRLARILRLAVNKFTRRSFDLARMMRPSPINLKPQRHYDWGRWYKPQVASLRHEWLSLWSAPRRLPLLLLVGLRRCFIIFILCALSFYMVLGGGSALAVGWQKQQALAPAAEQIVYKLETALSEIMRGKTQPATALLAETKEQLAALRADFGGINLAAAVLNQSRLGLTLLALRLGDELVGGIEEIAVAIEKLHKLELKPALATLERAYEHVAASQELLQLVDNSSLSSSQILRLEQLSKGLSQSAQLFGEMKQLSPLLLKLSGSPDPTKILVLFQNTGEARATGGFIGAFAIISFNNGKVSQFTVHDSYDFDGRLFQQVKAPPFLRPYVNNIALRDSNHDPDFPTSARLASWFLEQEKGPTVDAVIAVDEQALAALLTLTGPIHLPSYGATVSAKNFYLLLEYIIETSKDHPETPKQVLIDLIDKLVVRLGDNPQPLALLESAFDLASSKHMLLYTQDKTINDAAASIGLSGSFPPALNPKEDFLAVLCTALSGNKSDYFLTTGYTHHTNIGTNGKLIDRLQIERRHHFGKEEEQFVRQQPQFVSEQRLSGGNLLNTLGAGRNNELIRVFVPLGSKLLSTHGVDIDDVTVREDTKIGLTVFEFLQATERGDTSKVALRYELPFFLPPEEFALYHLRIYHQPGQSQILMNKEVTTNGKKLLYLNEQQKLASTSLYSNSFELSNDYIFAIIAQQQQI